MLLGPVQPDELNQRLRDAAMHNQYQEVGRLLAAGASATSADAEGFTPMHAAATTGSLKLLKRLQKHGADAQARDKVCGRLVAPHQVLGSPHAVLCPDMQYGDTGMLYAALANHVRSVHFFLENGCDYMHMGQVRVPIGCSGRCGHQYSPTVARTGREDGIGSCAGDG